MSLFVRVLIKTVVQSTVVRANPVISLKRTRYLYSESERPSMSLAVGFATRRIKP